MMRLVAATLWGAALLAGSPALAQPGDEPGQPPAPPPELAPVAPAPAAPPSADAPAAVVAPASPPASEEPRQFTVPASVTPITDERSMRFVLEGGNVVVGRRIGEDAEYFWVMIDGRPARVRKSEVASIDFRLDGDLPQAPMGGRHDLPPPLESGPGDPAVPHQRGKGLVIGGSVLFGLFYLASAVYAPSADGPGALLLIPIFGPVFYGFAHESTGDEMAVEVVASLLQAGGAVMLYFGIRQSMDDDDEELARARPPALAIVPRLSRLGGSLSVLGRF